MAASQAKPAKPKKRMGRPPIVDKDRIIKLGTENSNLTVREIGQLTDTGKSRVAEIIREAKESPDMLLFQENKAEVFEGVQHRLLNLADDDLLKTMLSKRGMTDVGILEDKIRTIRGQAVAISEVNLRALGVLLDATPRPERATGPVDNSCYQPPVDVD